MPQSWCNSQSHFFAWNYIVIGSCSFCSSTGKCTSKFFGPCQETLAGRSGLQICLRPIKIHPARSYRARYQRRVYSSCIWNPRPCSFRTWWPWGIQSVSNTAENAVSGSQWREPLRIHCVSDSLLHFHEKYSRSVTKLTTQKIRNQYFLTSGHIKIFCNIFNFRLNDNFSSTFDRG